MGLDRDRLEEFEDKTGGIQGIVTRYGYRVHSWGKESEEHDWSSVTKSVVTTLLFFAIEEGRLSGVNDLVAPRLPAYWSSPNRTLDSVDQSITFAHLANHTSGYALAESPGEVWAYNDVATRLYTNTLFQGVFDERKDNEKANAVLLQRLGALDFEDDDGEILEVSEYGDPRVYTTSKDVARLGWFWLNKGAWRGTQILPREFFDHYVRPTVPFNLARAASAGDDYLGIGHSGGGANITPLGPGVYGYNFWFNTDARPWPVAPPDAFKAMGKRNRAVVLVIPSLALVAAWQGTQAAAPEEIHAHLNESIRPLIAAVVDQSGESSRHRNDDDATQIREAQAQPAERLRVNEL